MLTLTLREWCFLVFLSMGYPFQTWTHCTEKQIPEPKAVVTEERPRNTTFSKADMKVDKNIQKEDKTKL